MDDIQARDILRDAPALFSDRRVKLAVAAVCLFAVAIAYLVISRSMSRQGDAGQSAMPAVTVALAQQREVPIVLDAPGTVTPLNSVTVRSRVDGELLSVHFSEGDVVRAGQIIARIDPRPMRTALRQANASLRRENTRLENASLQLSRAEALIEKGFVTKSALDEKRAEMEAAKAEAEASRSTVDRAALELGYTTVRSPISGRTGFRLIDPGSLVSAAERSPIVVVTQQQPIAVVFSLPQKDLGAVARGLKRGDGLAVELRDGNGPDVIARGHVTTFDNAIDQQSGTFQVKASFPNGDLSLWPGQFVDVRLVVDNVPNGIVVPAEAVQRGPESDFVFVVDPKGVARMRAVSVVQRVGGEALIGRGLSRGDSVVVDGVYGLRSGMKIRVSKESGR